MHPDFFTVNSFYKVLKMNIVYCTKLTTSVYVIDNNNKSIRIMAKQI